MNNFGKLLHLLLWGCVFVTLFSSCNIGRDKQEEQDRGKKIVVLSPPIYSMLKLFPSDSINIVGANPRTFETAHTGLLEIIDSQYREIRTDFADGDFNVNRETLLSFHPDIIFYYGDFQKVIADRLPIQTIDVNIKQSDPEIITVEWERLLSQALKHSYAGIMEKEWQHMRERCRELCRTIAAPKRGLFVFSYLNGRITVSGKNSYGGAFLAKAGIINVAEELSGEKEIGKEQLYNWKPDVVFLFLGSKSTFLKDIEKKDFLSVYSIPKGIFSWGSPCVESPLMPLWLLAKSYSQVYPKDKFKDEMRRFYANVFDKKVPDFVLNEILDDK